MSNHTPFYLLMKITIKVIPGASKNAWSDESGSIKVYLMAPPQEGKANTALVKFLAKHFGVRPCAIEILKGLKSRHKIVNIEGI